MQMVGRRFWIITGFLVLIGTVGCAPTSAHSSDPAWPPSHWMTNYPSKHVVALTIIANSSPEGPTLDGTRHGSLVFQVPTGDTIMVFFGNHDATQPHSLALVGASHTPLGVPRGRLRRGLGVRHHASFQFVAPSLGVYRLASLVPSDHKKGLWISLDIVSRRHIPTARMTKD